MRLPRCSQKLCYHHCSLVFGLWTLAEHLLVISSISSKLTKLYSSNTLPFFLHRPPVIAAVRDVQRATLATNGNAKSSMTIFALPIPFHRTTSTIPTFKSEASNTDAKELFQSLPRVRDMFPAPTGHPDFQSLRSRTGPSSSPMAAEMSDATVGTKLGSERSLIARTCSTSHVENAFFGTAPRWERASATRRAPDSFTISRRHHTCSPIGRTTSWRPLSDQPTE